MSETFPTGDVEDAVLDILAGSQEVTSSILVSSTNRINSLQPSRISRILPDSLCLQIACIFFFVEHARSDAAHARNPVRINPQGDRRIRVSEL